MRRTSPRWPLPLSAIRTTVTPGRWNGSSAASTWAPAAMPYGILQEWGVSLTSLRFLYRCPHEQDGPAGPDLALHARGRCLRQDLHLAHDHTVCAEDHGHHAVASAPAGAPPAQSGNPPAQNEGGHARVALLVAGVGERRV